MHTPPPDGPASKFEWSSGSNGTHASGSISAAASAQQHCRPPATSAMLCGAGGRRGSCLMHVLSACGNHAVRRCTLPIAGPPKSACSPQVRARQPGGAHAGPGAPRVRTGVAPPPRPGCGVRRAPPRTAATGTPPRRRSLQKFGQVEGGSTGVVRLWRSLQRFKGALAPCQRVAHSQPSRVPPHPSSPDATSCPSGDHAARMTESACPWKAATCM